MFLKVKNFFNIKNVIIILLLLSLGLTSAYFLNKLATTKKQNDLCLSRVNELNVFNANCEKNPKPQKPLGVDLTNRVYVKASPHATYYFITDLRTNSEECDFSIINKMGDTESYKEMDNSSVKCQPGMYGPQVEGFLGWSNDYTFILERNKGNLEVFNLKTDNKTQISYDPNALTFIEMDNKNEKIMFSKIAKNGLNSYIITDTNLNVLKTLNFKTITDMFEDNINNGFLVVEEETFKDSFENTVCEGFSNCSKNTFWFISFDTLNTKKLLETDLRGYHGKGCHPSFISPEKGKITLYPRCTAIDEKYLDENYLLELNLN